jgi:hypothetical protein
MAAVERWLLSVSLTGSLTKLTNNSRRGKILVGGVVKPESVWFITCDELQLAVFFCRDAHGDQFMFQHAKHSLADLSVTCTSQTHIHIQRHLDSLRPHGNLGRGRQPGEV